MAIFDNLFGAPPEYLTGLLGADETDKLRKQAMTTGLVNSAIALIAQPRNQRYGSALPYIGKALMAGQQAGQNVYSNALQGLETQQKLAELKRQQEQRAAQQEMLGTLTDPRERLFAQLAPTEFVKGQLATPKATAKLLTIDEQIGAGLPEVGRYQVKADGSYELVPGTAPKESSTPSAVQEYQFAKSQGYNGSFQDWKQSQKPAGVSVTYGAPVAGVNAQGDPVFFQPDKGGGAPAIIPGVAPSPQKMGEATQKQLTGIDSLQNSIQSYKNELKGWKTTDALNPAKRAKMGTVYNNMMLQAKEAYGLGVLNGPDYTILTDVIADPSSPKGVAYGAMGALESQADALDNLMTNMKQSIKQAQPGAKQIISKGEPMPTARRKFNPATGRIE